MATSCGFESHRPHQPSLAKRVKTAAPKPSAEGGPVAASYGLASHCPDGYDGLVNSGTPLPQSDLFEMRRLEMLSNTIFGVAMTLLAYDLPKASSFTQAPTWMGLVHVYAQPVIALMISFIVAGMFWFSHHRRLAVAPEGGRGVVFLNLFFLLSIILLPVTNGLYGAYRLDGVMAVLYGVHLTIIAGLNAVLWILALGGRSDPRLMATALLPLFVFVLGTAVAFVSPKAAQFVWGLAFLAWFAGRFAGHRAR